VRLELWARLFEVRPVFSFKLAVLHWFILMQTSTLFQIDSFGHSLINKMKQEDALCICFDVFNNTHVHTFIHPS
jgi:hypothetical protein